MVTYILEKVDVYTDLTQQYVQFSHSLVLQCIQVFENRLTQAHFCNYN